MNQPCSARPTLTNLNLDELHYYPFIISMNRCDGSCSTVKDPSGRICFSSKVEGVNLKIINMMKGINESMTLGKHISCDCRCDFGDRKCNSR